MKNTTKRGPGDPVWDPEPGETNWVHRVPGDRTVHAYRGVAPYTVCGLSVSRDSAIANAWPERCEYCLDGKPYPPMA